jgi:hypothetical protein
MKNSSSSTQEISPSLNILFLNGSNAETRITDILYVNFGRAAVYATAWPSR